jgi:hypothetical protein
LIAVTAAAATVGAVLVIGPGGAAAAGPGYALAALHAGPPQVPAVRLQAVRRGPMARLVATGLAAAAARRQAMPGISVGPAPVTCPGSESPGRSARRPGGLSL